MRSTRSACSLVARRLTRRVAHNRYLFKLIDVQNDNSLQDEELVPILMAAGLDEAAAHAVCARLLGGQLTVRPPTPGVLHPHLFVTRPAASTR